MKRKQRLKREQLRSVAWMLAAFVGLLLLNAYIFYFRKGTSLRSLLSNRTHTIPAVAPAGSTIKTESTADKRAIAGAVEPEDQTVDDVIYAGETIDRALKRRNIDNLDRRAIWAALQKVFDAKLVQPGQHFLLQSNLDGELKAFDLRVTPVLAYHVYCPERINAAKSGDHAAPAKESAGVTCNWAVDKVVEPLQTRLVQVGGTVGSSLYEAIRRTGEPGALVSKMVELFAWDINFFTDTRPGDTFRVIVEKRYLGNKFYKYGPITAAEYRGRMGAIRIFWFESSDRTISGYYTEHGENVVRGLLKTPLRYVRISSRYDAHRFHPILHDDRAHLGVDFAAPTGTPVWATADGKVAFAGPKGGAGKMIALAHRGGLASIYMHLSKIVATIRPGQIVHQKQVIGYVGATGLATGPHLHFSLKKDGKFIDPLKFKVDRGVPLSDKWRADFADLVGSALPKLVSIEVAAPAGMATRGPSPLP